MYSWINNIAGKTTAVIATLALLLGSSSVALGPVFVAQAAEGDVTVTIDKFIDGEMATSESANGLSFPMSATWNASNIGAGTGSYELSASSYEAQTAEMASGADYSTNEVTGGESVGAACEEGKPFSLVGYTTGDTFEEAAAGTPSLTIPAFTGMTTSKFVIVWNEDCSEPVAPESVQVTINKYLDGTQATAESADSASFPMTAVWNDAEGIGAGTGGFTLDAGSDPAYEAATIEFNPGADYSASEDTGGAVVGASCETEQPYALQGYTTGSSPEEAAAGTPSLVAPAFTGMTEDEYVIVWNITCDGSGSGDEGTIGGDVEGGTSEEGDLEVTSIEATDTTATADGTFENGWKYTFNITVPDDESNLSMKFADWLHTNQVSTIAAGGNMRISSAQANNGNATVPVTAANTYTAPPLTMTGDLSAGTPGKQVKVLVEVAVPNGSTNGSYTTNYGVQTLP